ncbi:hypothetical protein QN277_020381 [Acacia crassicarpa]|uniref:Uncharacterized protein n=1 Tax=Acacia crassicarpa TaxID=499986 RepID=A0AAE1MPA9_9FABA|nr:hypothetical protein QN277_020381 [Acacia crassicarpa]
MDACQVLQSLDSLWFFTNIFTRSDDHLPSLSPPKCDSDTPHSPLVNLQDESDEIVETVNVNTPCEPETEVKDRGGGTKRKKRTKRSERHGTRRIEYAKKLLTTTTPFRLDPTSMTLPYDDEISMKEHLKSWACAVACIVK